MSDEAHSNAPVVANTHNTDSNSTGVTSAAPPTSTGQVLATPTCDPIDSEGQPSSQAELDAAWEAQRARQQYYVYARGGNKDAITQIVGRTTWIGMEDHPLGMAFDVMSGLDVAKVRSLVDFIVPTEQELPVTEEPGMLYVWPRRERVNDKWTDCRRWSVGANQHSAILAQMQQQIGLVQAGLTRKWERKFVLTVRVTGEKYCDAIDWIQKNDLEYEVATIPPVSTAFLEIRHTGPRQTQMGASVAKEQQANLERLYPGLRWGRTEPIVGYKVMVMIPRALTHEDAFTSTNGVWKTRFYLASSNEEKPAAAKAANDTIAKDWARRNAEQFKQTLIRDGLVPEDVIARIDKNNDDSDDESEGAQTRQAIKSELSNRNKILTSTLRQVAQVLTNCHIDSKGREAAMALISESMPEGVGRANAYVAALATIDSPKQLERVIELTGDIRRGVPDWEARVKTWAQHLVTQPPPPPVKMLNGRAATKPNKKRANKNDKPATNPNKTKEAAKRGK
jgi:hypothetical protein